MNESCWLVAPQKPFSHKKKEKEKSEKGKTHNTHHHDDGGAHNTTHKKQKFEDTPENLIIAHNSNSRSLFENK